MTPRDLELVAQKGQNYAYIGKKPCGCVVAAVVDDDRDKEFTAEKVADFIKQGYSVERVQMSQVNLKRCICQTAEQPRIYSKP